MRFLGVEIRQVNRMTREHALLLLFASAAILFLTLPSRSTKPIAINWPSAIAGRNEAEIDARSSIHNWLMSRR
jgi:hypothetical protein